MNQEERFLFDLMGYMTVENALSVGEVQELNRLLDEYDLWNADSHNGLPLRHHMRRNNVIHAGWMHEWAEPFRQLLNHPKMMPYLIELVGPKFRYDHGYAILMKQGGEKGRLHGGEGPYGGEYYICQNGQMYNGLIVVSYALRDVGPGDGGFAAVPGSHKSNFPCPENIRTYENQGPWLQQVPQKAGSAVIFTEALTHGTWAWTAPTERRSLLIKYSPGYMSWLRQYPSTTDVPNVDWDPVQRRILEPPYVGGRAKVDENR